MIELIVIKHNINVLPVLHHFAVNVGIKMKLSPNLAYVAMISIIFNVFASLKMVSHDEECGKNDTLN